MEERKPRYDDEAQTENKGRPLRARPAVNKGRTADSMQLSILDYSISRDPPIFRPVTDNERRRTRTWRRRSCVKLDVIAHAVACSSWR